MNTDTVIIISTNITVAIGIIAIIFNLSNKINKLEITIEKLNSKFDRLDDKYANLNQRVDKIEVENKNLLNKILDKIPKAVL